MSMDRSGGAKLGRWLRRSRRRPYAAFEFRNSGSHPPSPSTIWSDSRWS